MYSTTVKYLSIKIQRSHCFFFQLEKSRRKGWAHIFLSNTSYEKCYTQYVHSPLFHTYGCHKVFYLSWLLFILLFIILQCHTVVLLLDIHIALNARLDGNIIITKTLIIWENCSLYFLHIFIKCYIPILNPNYVFSTSQIHKYGYKFCIIVLHVIMRDIIQHVRCREKPISN